MSLLAIKKYPKIYLTLLKYSFIEGTTYHISFLIQLFVEIGYSFALILFFYVIYSNIKEIVGWNYNEILFLLGLSIIADEVLLGAVSIFNLRRLPDKIRTGEIDFTLLKPIHSLFHLSLGKPYFTSFLSVIPGCYLMHYSIKQLGLGIEFFDLISGLFIFICGLIIGYSILVIISSLSFVFINAKPLPKIAENIMFYNERPHQVYRGFLKLIFFYIFPVVFICSIPSSAILRGVEPEYLLLSFILASVFLFGSVKIWNRLIKNYTSASS